MLPEQVILCEVGPRDGFQAEAQPIPTETKVSVIEALVEAGLPEIQIASFVHPKWVPQMADAEDVCRQVERKAGVVYTGLALNEKGVERAYRAGLRHVDLSIATSDAHSRRNANMSLNEAVAQMLAMIRQCHVYGVHPRAGLQTVFGYEQTGDIPLEHILKLSEQIVGAGVASLSLADSTGRAHPIQMKEVLQAVRQVVGETPLVLHLHDTRGLGLANVVAALECGIDRFDTSFAGMGGCPFIPGATGNIATEDTVYLLNSLGIETGIDLEKVAAVSRRVERLLGKQFSGKLHRLVEKG